MAMQLQIRRDTAANWTTKNPILAQGEMGYETDTNKFKWGDGTIAWASLSYFGIGSGVTGVSSFNTRTGAVVPATNDYTWAQVNKATSNIADITTKSHTSLTDIGTNTHVQIDTFIASKGASLGLATLDGGGKVPASELPATLLVYLGTWNASTNTPTLSDATGTGGDVYIVTVAGTQNLGSGAQTFAIGDWVMHNGSIWEKSINSNAVASVNGYTGVVVLAKSDVGLGSVENTALSTWAGTANITTLGTIGTGVWNGTAIADTYISSAATWNAKQAALTFSTGLTNSANTITNNLSVGISGGQTVIGGTGVTDILNLQGTTGNGTLTSAAIRLLVGNNGATNALTVLNNGNVGIGTTAPNQKLSVSSATNGDGLELTGAQIPGLRWTTTSANANARNWGIFTNYTDFGDFHIRVSSANNTAPYVGASADKMTILSNGNVGLGGLTVPGEILSIAGHLMVGDSTWSTGTTTGSVAIQGNVGIGTTGPGKLLSVGANLWQIDSSGIQWNNSAQTTYTGSITGIAKWSMPFQGSTYKKFVINYNALHDAGGTITFPTVFTTTPFVYGDAAALAISSATTTTFTIAAAATITGNVFVEGF